MTFTVYADDTTLNSTLDSFCNDTEEIQNSIISEFKKVFKWFDVNKLRFESLKVKIYAFSNAPEKGSESII